MNIRYNSQSKYKKYVGIYIKFKERSECRVIFARNS